LGFLNRGGNPSTRLAGDRAGESRGSRRIEFARSTAAERKTGENGGAARSLGGADGEAGTPEISAASHSRERWVYGLHALAGILLALPTLGLIGDWLLGGLEAYWFLLVAMLGLVIWPLLLFFAVGWVALIGYWLWTGDARRRGFLVAWYASAALSPLVLFWPWFRAYQRSGRDQGRRVVRPAVKRVPTLADEGAVGSHTDGLIKTDRFPSVKFIPSLWPHRLRMDHHPSTPIERHGLEPPSWRGWATAFCCR